MTRQWRRIVPAVLALALAGSGAMAAAERMYDNEVKRLIEYTNRGVNDFRKAVRSDFKNSRITWNGMQVDVGTYLGDLADAGKKLGSRYETNYAAVPEATDFLKRIKVADEFAKENPGISGAKNEWDLLLPNAVALAKAYGIDFSADPSTWQAARTPDGPLRATAASIETQAKGIGKSLDQAAKASGLDKSRRKVLEGQAETAIKAAGDLRKAIDGSRPASGAIQSLSSALGDLGATAEKDGVAGNVSAAWTALQDNVGKLSGLVGQ